MKNPTKKRASAKLPATSSTQSQTILHYSEAHVHQKHTHYTAIPSSVAATPSPSDRAPFFLPSFASQHPFFDTPSSDRSLPAPMINFGTSCCYLNSVLQCLFQCPPFINYYLSDMVDNDLRSLQTNSSSQVELYLMLHQVMKALIQLYWCNPDEPLPSYSLLSALNPLITPTYFQPSTQQDAQEFFMHLFTALV